MYPQMTLPIPSQENALAVKAAALTAARGESFADLLAQTTEGVSGRNVVNTELLTGVPFIVTGARYHAGKGGDFVSLECTAADRTTLVKVFQSGRTAVAAFDMLPVVGDEQFVINDSGTGIRRQITSWLHEKGLITCNLEWDFQAADKTDVFDQPILDKKENPVWLNGVNDALEGFTGLRFLCPRGTRVSTYDYAGDQARTVYLA